MPQTSKALCPFYAINEASRDMTNTRFTGSSMVTPGFLRETLVHMCTASAMSSSTRHTSMDIHKRTVEHITYDSLQYVQHNSGISSLLYIYWADNLYLHTAFCTGFPDAGSLAGQINRPGHWEFLDDRILSPYGWRTKRNTIPGL